MNFFFLLLGFIPLICGASLLVDSSVALAKRFNIPSIVIGLTIVAFGTSSPELIVNIVSSLSGSPDLALGNIVGSNIFNILIILGISAMIVPLAVKTNTVWIEVPLCLLSAVVILFLANDLIIDGAPVSVLSRIDGLILLSFFSIFIGYSIKIMLKGSFEEELAVKSYSVALAVLLVFLGIVLLYVGGRVIVVYAVKLAESFGMTERVIALTIVSAGTSLPELTTSVVAAKKKNVDIALGNIVGSNIFNVFFILGLSAVILPIPLQGMANLDLIVNAFVSLLLFIFLFTGKGRRLERWEGALFIFFYCAYLATLLII